MPSPLHIVLSPGAGHGDDGALRAAIVAACQAAGRPLQLLDVQGRRRTLRTPTLFVGNNALQLQQMACPRRTTWRPARWRWWR